MPERTPTGWKRLVIAVHPETGEYNLLSGSEPSPDSDQIDPAFERLKDRLNIAQSHEIQTLRDRIADLVGQLNVYRHLADHYDRPPGKSHIDHLRYLCIKADVDPNQTIAACGCIVNRGWRCQMCGDP